MDSSEVDKMLIDEEPEEEEPSHDDHDSLKILAWDYSGSTCGAEYYHRIGQKYLDNFSTKFESSSKPIYLTWTDSANVVTLKELKDICQQRKGTNGTYPTTICNWIIDNIPKEKSIELWLVTDGGIDTYELEKCATLNQQINYCRVNFIVINERRSQMNMSVGAAFFRATKLRIFNNESLYKQINTSKPFDYDSITSENFESQWEVLSDFIQAKFMGTDVQSLEEVEKLSALRRRLLKSLDGEGVNKNSDFSSKKRSDLLDALRSCLFYKNLMEIEVRTAREKIDENIGVLINYIHNKRRSCDFESIKWDFKQNKIELISEESEPQLEDLDDLETCTIFDAVTLENEENVPVLLITVTDLMQKYWIDGNFTKYRTIMDCPLMANVDKCIGHVYTYNTFKSLCASDTGTIVNPMTNEPVYGGLIFDESADKWNDYVLAKSFFRGKKVLTCPALWYYVIWRNAKNAPWVESDVVDMLRTYAFRRMKRANVRLAFGRLPLDPKEVVPVDVACYYCTEGSSLLFGEDQTLFPHERLRQYWSVAESMVDILEHFEYVDVDKEFVMKRAKVFENMTQLKRIPQELEKRYYLLQNIFESKGPFLTPVIKDKEAVGFVNLLQYHHNISMIPFSFDKNLVDIRPWLLVSYDKSQPETAELCPNTCRPYFVLQTDSNGLVPNYKQVFSYITETILDCSGEIIGQSAVTKLNQSKLVSGFKLYIDQTMQLKRFPTLEEYSKYTWEKKKFHGSKVRLFNTQIMSNIQEVFDLYSKLGIGVDEFIEKAKISVNISNRIMLEQRLLNKSTEEFINMAKDMLVTELPTVAQQMAELKQLNKSKLVVRNPKPSARAIKRQQVKIEFLKKRHEFRRSARQKNVRRNRFTYQFDDGDVLWDYIGDKTRSYRTRVAKRKAQKREKRAIEHSKLFKEIRGTLNVRTNKKQLQKLRMKKSQPKRRVLCHYFSDDDFSVSGNKTKYRKMCKDTSGDEWLTD